MKRFAYAAAIAVLSTSVMSFAVSAAQEHPHDMKMPASAKVSADTQTPATEAGKPVTLVGEVIDMYCYMSHPAEGQGPGHAKCAQACMRNGLPIGFLSDGKVYLIIGGKDHANAKDLVVDFAGKQSRLTGTLISHDGVNALEIDKIENVTPQSGM